MGKNSAGRSRAREELIAAAASAFPGCRVQRFRRASRDCRGDAPGDHGREDDVVCGGDNNNGV